MSGSAKLIVALDYSRWEDAEKLITKLPEVDVFKVGLELYLASRGEAVENVKRLGKKVFLDLKFHDIPNTVSQASRQAVKQGAAMFTIHTAGGRTMLSEAVKAARQEAQQAGSECKVLGITMLTSLNEMDLKEIGLPPLEQSVKNLALLAREAGLDGVVASPREIRLIREACGPQLLLVCPGVRPAWAATGDQKRVLTPGEAAALGANYLVVGRPITAAADPREAALRILEEMEGV